MQISNWILIFTALFLGACALFVPYLAELLKRKVFAPKLNILFDFAPPFCHKTLWRFPRGSKIQMAVTKNCSSVSYDQEEQPVYYFRFQIINKGKSVAKNCEVVLENIWISDAYSKYKIYHNFSPVNMKWSGTSSKFIDINPKRRVFCDIGHISSEKYQKEIENNIFIDIPDYIEIEYELRFMLDLYEFFFSQANCLVPGKYILQFGLYSENADYQKAFFDISWSGKWRDGEAEMFREIVISRTKNFL